jgi:hypothetical protein
MNKLYPSKIFFNVIIAVLLCITAFNGCKKSDSNTDGSLATPPDLTTKVSSSVSGFVTDENDQAVISASVQFGTATITTDKYGYFEAKNIDVIKDAATVTVTKPGYFKGIKTYIAAAGKAAFFRIKLIPKNIVGTINGSTGGAVTLTNGLSISLPANAIVNNTTNAAYTGTVNVSAYWINPTSADLPQIMPGDLRGINTDGNAQLLTTYGMAAVELTGAGGELLQIATGKKATLSLPIPASILSTAPVTIPLWYFDEAKGLWKQEGIATKTGSNYVGEVSHFSFWNCDAPANYVQFNCTLVDQNNHPLPYAFVKISAISNPANAAFGLTDVSGYVAGLVPDNAQLKMEVFSDASCTTNPIYTQTFTTTNTNISLGTLLINNPAVILNLSGTATNCSNSSLNQGLVVIKYGNRFYVYPITNGVYNFNLPVCNAPATVSISVVDLSNQQTSLPMSYVLNAGNNTMPNVQACGTAPAEYAYYVVDNTAYYKATGNAYFSQVFYIRQQAPQTHTDAFSVSFDPGSTVPHSGFSVERPGSFPITSAPLLGFYIHQGPSGSPFPNPIIVNYTEFGNIGQYIAGSFSGTVMQTNVNVIHNVTCSFRIKRRF